MATIAYAVAFLLAAVLIARRSMRRRDANRRQSERKLFDDRKAAERSRRAHAAVGEIAARYFPFAQKAFEVEADRGGDATRRLKSILNDTSGITLGIADIGFPARLPLSERRKGLLVLGKSGYGKTTIANRLIRDDLEAGRAVCILGSEAELFRDWVLPLVPLSRASDVIAFRPADPLCTLTWNVLSLESGDDRGLAAGQLFSIFKRAVGETSGIGARADAILSCAFATLVGRSGATLWSVLRMLEDAEFRAQVIAEVDDPYLRDFWSKTFPEYPAGAVLPLANRFNQFLRLPQLRAALCHPISSFSVREALASDRIVFFDLSGLDPDATSLVGQMLLSKFQLELMRREQVPESERRSVHVYVDEFHVFASESEGTWRELLARGRRYGLGLHLFSQHPNQLPRSLQHEIFGNVSSLIALALSGNDAATVRRELLVPASDGGAKPVQAEAIVSLGVGGGFARLGSGACALKVKFAEPIERPDARLGDRIRDVSWRTYAAPPVPSPLQRVLSAGPDTRGEVAVQAKDPGRGGAKHKLLQRLARDWAESRGLRTTVEQEILGGAGRVDVALVRGDIRIAVEVAITSTPDQIAASVTKAFTAGFGTVVVLSGEKEVLGRVENPVIERLDARDRDRVRFVDADGFRTFLDQLELVADGSSPGGYRVVVEKEPVSQGRLAARRRTLAQLAGVALLRERGQP